MAVPASSPFALPIQPERIPAELRAGSQFVVWKYVWRGSKWTKPPRSAHTGDMASSTDPTTWTDFPTALAYASRHYAGSGGVGRVFAATDPYSGVDLDKCRDPDTGAIAEWAREIVRALDSYTEVSPSGTGVKITVRATLPVMGRRKGAIEMYREGRYFTFTGEHVAGTPTAPEERQEALTGLYSRIFATQTEPEDEDENSPRSTQRQMPHEPNNATDDELLTFAQRSKNGDKFTCLWAGNIAGYDSRSDADLALCSLLAFYTGPDPTRIDRLFRRSGLMRDKWDERRGTQMYGQLTTAKAIAGRTEYWTPGERFADYRAGQEAETPGAPES